MSLPKLATKGVFKFHPSTKAAAPVDETAIDIIIKILKQKFTKVGKQNRIYLLEARTGSGKSTMLISSLFDHFHCRIICSQPRVVLTEANANVIITHNPRYKLGTNVGIQSSAQRIIPIQRESISYSTTQIVSDMLCKAKYHNTIFVIDEVHTLDLPMMSLLKVVLDVLDKHGDSPDCPMFIFSSATIDTINVAKYYGVDLSNPLMYGFVGGSANYPVQEYFLNNDTMKMLINRELQLGTRDACFAILATFYYSKIYGKTLENISGTLVKNSDELSSMNINENSLMKISGGTLMNANEETIMNINDESSSAKFNDVLIFLPLTSGIETFGKTLRHLIKDKPVYLIFRGTTMDEVNGWRNNNRNKKRVLIVSFARDYSSASDFILSTSIDPDAESLANEMKIFVTTSILETGKTIDTLKLCIDLGLDTTTINHPLTVNYKEPLKYLRQIPANVNQTIQRMGRVGRVSPGSYIHCYTKEIYEKFQKKDTAQTINANNLSALLFRSISEKKVIDLVNENNYLIPTTVDIIIKTAQDLITSNFMSIYGEVLKSEAVEHWMFYAKYLYTILNFSLFDSLLLAQLNKWRLPPTYTVRDFDPNTLENKLKTVYDNSNPTTEIIDAIRIARNYVSLTKHYRISPFPLIKQRLINEGE